MPETVLGEVKYRIIFENFEEAKQQLASLGSVVAGGGNSSRSTGGGRGHASAMAEGGIASPAPSVGFGVSSNQSRSSAGGVSASMLGKSDPNWDQAFQPRRPAPNWTFGSRLALPAPGQGMASSSSGFSPYGVESSWGGYSPSNPDNAFGVMSGSGVSGMRVRGDASGAYAVGGDNPDRANNRRWSATLQSKLSQRRADDLEGFLNPNSGAQAITPLFEDDGKNKTGGGLLSGLSKRFLVLEAIRTSADFARGSDAYGNANYNSNFASTASGARLERAQASDAMWNSTWVGSLVGFGANRLGIGPQQGVQSAVLGVAQAQARTGLGVASIGANLAASQAAMNPGNPIETSYSGEKAAMAALAQFRVSSRDQGLQYLEQARSLDPAISAVGKSNLATLDAQRESLSSAVDSARKVGALDRTRSAQGDIASRLGFDSRGRAANGGQSPYASSQAEWERSNLKFNQDAEQQLFKNSNSTGVGPGFKWNTGFGQGAFDSLTNAQGREMSVATGKIAAGRVSEWFDLKAGNIGALGASASYGNFGQGVANSYATALGVRASTALMNENRPFDESRNDIETTRKTSIAAASKRGSGELSRGNVFGFLASLGEISNINANADRGIANVNRGERITTRDIELGQSTRSKQLSALLSRDRIGAHAIGIEGGSEAEINRLLDMGLKGQAREAGKIGTQELALDKQDYLLGFRGKQVDIRNIGIDSARDVENPTQVLKTIQDQVSKLLDKINSIT